MSSGLLALLDDVAALVKVSAASLDDIPAQVAKTSTKISGVVIDDAAVTPKYVVGLNPARELSIIYEIAKKSLRNKLIFLGPGALMLGFFIPWLMQPLLMIGGAYLCFEGYEKVHSIFSKHDESEADAIKAISPAELEKIRIASAVRTDLILSSEIIAITYANVAEEPLLTQITVMACVAIGITVAVYGFVGFLVKMDDIGLHLAKGPYPALIRKLGRGMVKCMPDFLSILGYIGTAAMLWVGAEIIAHGIPFLHHGLESIQQALPGGAVLAWMGKAAICAIGGLALGAMIERCIAQIRKLVKRRMKL